VTLAQEPQTTQKCPTPKPLSCQRLKALLDERCGGWNTGGGSAPKCPPGAAEAPRTADPAPKGPEARPCPVCPVAGLVAAPPARVIRETLIVNELDHKGHFGVGLGPAYFHGIGAQLFGGYKFASSHWEVGANVLYVPQNDVPEYDGVAVKGCHKIPFVVPSQEAPHPWGAGLMAVYWF
jgi:hypothetical protein